MSLYSVLSDILARLHVTHSQNTSVHSVMCLMMMMMMMMLCGCAYMCVYQGTHVEVRRQLCGVNSLLPHFCVFLGHQVCVAWDFLLSQLILPACADTQLQFHSSKQFAGSVPDSMTTPRMLYTSSKQSNYAKCTTYSVDVIKKY